MNPRHAAELRERLQDAGIFESLSISRCSQMQLEIFRNGNEVHKIDHLHRENIR